MVPLQASKVSLTHRCPCEWKLVLGIRESVCEGVPMVVMPMFAEQRRSAEIMKRKKVAVLVDKKQLTAEKLEHALRTVLCESFHENAVHLQKTMRDTLLDGTSRAVFASELMIRHSGLPGKFFRKQARVLGLYQFYPADLFSLFFFNVLSVTIFSI